MTSQTKLPDFDAAALAEITKKPIRIAIAGHANVGKTSVVRTLCRIADFGDVADFPGVTTRAYG